MNIEIKKDNQERKSFFTVVNCMDGRVQLPVIKYLQERFKVEYIDSITEPGPNLILAEAADTNIVESILKRIEISVGNHQSEGIAVVGHFDCAGNPGGYDLQSTHTKKAMLFLKGRYEAMKIIGLWVDEGWSVHEVGCA